MTQVWRINIKPDPKECVDPRAFCLEKGLLGVGWAVDGVPDINWDTYYKLAKQKYTDNGWWPALNALKNRMVIDDLCWTRDLNGIYYIGRVTGDWEYESGKDYLEADIVNVRTCDWKKVGAIDSVPGKVIRSFIPPRTLQIIEDDTVQVLSQYLYNNYSVDFKYSIDCASLPDIFSLLSPEDCEDLVGLYLQSEGYFIIPSTCKIDTLAYEYVLIHKDTGKSAVAQVKSGYVDLDSESPPNVQGEVYLFTSHGKYTGIKGNNVNCLKRDLLEKFMEERFDVLPERIQSWIKLNNGLGSS